MDLSVKKTDQQKIGHIPPVFSTNAPLHPCIQQALFENGLFSRHCARCWGYKDDETQSCSQDVLLVREGETETQAQQTTRDDVRRSHTGLRRATLGGS